MSRILMVLMVSAALGVGVLMAGAGGSKVDASPSANEGASSTMPHQQGGHKGGLDPALEKSLEAAFEKSFEQSGVPGAIAAVRTPEGTWVSALGVANRASGKPMRADMHHRIGSVTKTFTATLLLKADAEGLLSLDEKFQKALFSNPRKVWKPEKLARIGIKDSPVFDPGKGWQYSNTNYIMLGLVLEQVTGKQIGELYQKEIIKSLHLKETS